MAGTYQDWFNLYSNADQATVYNEVSQRQAAQAAQQTKQATVDRASKQKQDELRRLTDPRVASQVMASQASGNGFASGSEMEQDFRTLTGPQLVAKYGQDVGNQLLNSRTQADLGYTDSMSQQRSAPEIAGDVALDAGSAFVGGIGGIASWGIGEVNDDAGIAAARFTNTVTNFLRNRQTDVVKEQRAIVGAQNQYARRDNQVQFEQDLAAGDNPWAAILMREGRNFVDTAANVLDNGTVTTGIGAEAVGSLFGGAKVAGVLRKVGSKVLSTTAKAGVLGGAAGSVAAGRALDLAQKAGSFAAMPASIGLMEGGTAYTGTVEEALSLLADRDIPDDLKIQMANEAATIAARAQAPIGAVTGMLVARFEQKLAKGALNVSPKEALIGAVRETAEESIQSFSGAVAQNEGIRISGIDPNRDPLLGTGEQVAYGAIGGSLASGGLSTPGVVLTSAGKATKAVADAGMQAGAKVFDVAITGLANKGRALQSTMADKFTGGREAISNQLTSLLSRVPEDQRADAEAKAASILSRVGSTTTQVRDQLKAVIENLPEGAALWEEMKTGLPNTRMFLADKIDQALAKLPEDVQAKAKARANNIYRKFSGNAEATSEQVLAEMPDLNIDVTTDEVADPTNSSDAIDVAVAKAVVSPNKVNPEVNSIILKHADDGKIALTSTQRGALQASSSLVQAKQEHEAVQRSLRQVDRRLVTQDIQNEADQAFRDVIRAVGSRNIEEAKKRLEDFRQFTQLFHNKVNALNEHLALGTGQKTDAVQYQNLIGEYGSRRWIPIQPDKGMWVNAKAPKTVAFAQSVENDAQTLTSMANNLAKSFPELGFEPLPNVKLNLDAAPVKTPVATQEVPVQATPEVADTTQTEGGDQSVDVPVNDEVAQPVVESKVAEAAVTESVIDLVVEPTIEPVSETPTEEVISESPETKSTEATPSEQGSAEEVVPGKAEQVSKTETVDRTADAAGIGTDTGTTRFSVLISDWFTKAFKQPQDARTRTQGEASPLAVVKAALKSATALVTFIGRTPRHQITKPTIDAYQKLISEAQPVADEMAKNLNKFLNKELSGKKIGEHILEGTDPVSSKGKAYKLNTMINGKALNIVQVIGGKIRYNPELMELAVLAGLQWMVNKSNNWSMLSEKAVADIFEIDESNPRVAGLTAEMNRGMGLTEVNRSLAAQITRFWGMSENADADQSMVKGISEAVAGEVLRALEARNLVTSFTVKDPSGNSKKDVDRYVPYRPDVAIRAYPVAIEDAIVIDPENSFIGQAPSSVAQAQMNNPRARNTKSQMAALKAENQTPYRINPNVVEFFEVLGSNALLYLFGEGDLSGRPLNDNHARTLRGRNITIESAFDSLMDLLTELRSVAQAAGQDQAEVPVFFEHNFSSIGRMQQLGRNSPQASKLMREALLPTWSTLDLSGDNLEHTQAYYLSLAQSLGVKVENLGVRASIENVVGKLYGDLEPAVKVLQDWLNQDKKKSLTSSQMDVIRKALGKDREVRAFHALLDWAKLLNTEDKSAFKTAMYLEADGKTNGPINAMALFSSGAFTQQWVVGMAKGGLIIDTPGMTLAEQHSRDGNDLYQTAANRLSVLLSATRENMMQRGDTELSSQMDNLLSLMNILIPDSMVINEDGTIEISRGTAKNPLTITLYGSSPRGIASNLVGEMVGALYERLSGAMDLMSGDPDISMADALFGDQATDLFTSEQMLKQVETALNGLLTKRAYTRNNRVLLANSGIAPVSLMNVNLKSFTLGDEQLKTMISNMEHLVVAEMVRAIEKTVGEKLINTLTTVRKATQVQGIILKYAFQRELRKALEKKAEGEFLSQKELGAIWDKLSFLSPMIDTGSALFDVAGTARADVDLNEFGRAFDDSSRTDAYIYGPENPGVRGIPTMVIGSGDGQMMQIMSTMSDAIEGTLKVFDGVNIPLDKIQQGSNQANEAALQAWLGNPVQAVLDSYETFLKDLTLGTSEEEIFDLTRALFDEATARMGTMDESTLRAEIEALGVSLRVQAREANARRDVLEQINLSVDQMASAEAPHVQTGKLDLSDLTSAQIVDQMNKLLMENLSKQKAPASENIAPELEALATKHETGVYVLTTQDLPFLAQNANIPANQKALLADIVKSGVAEGYSIVFGATWQIVNYAYEEGKVLPDAISEGDKGLIVMADKTIYLNNVSPSSETLVHELIHGSTFEKLVTFYQGSSLGPNSVEQIRAIERLEALLEQFMALDVSALGDKTQIAYANAVATIEREQANMENEPAIRKAAALNEFMAWALSNQDLARTLARTKVDNPLVRLARNVIEGIKSLIWGNKHAPKVKDDMLSNLRFNTNILMHSGPTVQSIILDKVLYQTVRIESGSTNLKRVHDTLKARIVTYLDTKLENVSDRNSRYLQAVRIGIKAATSFNDNGFPMTFDERRTFQMVVASLATSNILDPNVLTEVNKLYTHVVKVLKPVHFMEDETSTDPNQLALAQQRYDAVVGNYFSAKDAENRSALLSTFLALSMVHDDFRMALAKLPVPSKKLGKWNTLDGVLENTGIIAMDRLGTAMSGVRRSNNVSQAVQALSSQMVELAVEEEPSSLMKAFSTLQEGIDKTNDMVVGAMRYSGQKLIDLSDKGLASTSNKVVRVVLNTTKMIGSMVDEDNGAAVAKDMISQANKSAAPTALKELLNEFVGRTDENAPIYDMIKLVRSWVQQTRQQFREKVPTVIANQFTRAVSDVEWKAMFHGMGKTDLASLIIHGGMTEARVMEMLTDPVELTKEISNLEASLNNDDAVKAPLWLTKAKELAEFMNKGKVPENLLRNAHAIANLRGESTSSKLAVTPSMVSKIDALVTLYALESLDLGTKTALSSLAQNQADGMIFALDYLVGQNRTEAGKPSWSELARENQYKGYIPSEQGTGMSLVVAPAADETQMRMYGFQKVADYISSKAEPQGVRLAYYFSSVGGRGQYNQGILQNIRATFGGVDPSTGFTNQGMTAGQITDPAAVKKITQNRRANGRNGSQALMPIYDGKGDVVAYERSIDPVQEARLERQEHLAQSIGIWRGRQVEEVQSQTFNDTLVGRLGAKWREDQAIRSDEYVNLFDPDVLKADRVLADSIGLLNRRTRQTIESQFGKGRFMVRKDMLNDVLGYRSASIGDLWTGTTRLSPAMQIKVRDALVGVFGIDAYSRLVKVEGIWQNLITDARVTIVVKSMIVPAANLVANLFQLMSRGIGIGTILKGFPKKTAEIDAFVNGRMKRLELEAELRASSRDPIKTRRLKNEIQAIMDNNRRLSIWPLIEAGEFASISDVGISQDELLLSKGRLNEYMERLASKLPDGLRTAGRYGIVSRDSALFKGLQRAVEYGDFLGKSVLYDNLINEKGLTKEQALARVSEEFVNYDRLPGRSRTYLESIGALWFWNFKIRSTKIALNLIRNNPLHSLLAMTGQLSNAFVSVGSPITDNAFAVFMDGRSGWSIGPSMAISAHSLNPWYNLTT